MRDLCAGSIADALNAWKEAPVILETCEPMSFLITSNYLWQQAIQCAIDNHASQFNDKNGAVPGVIHPAVRT